MGEERFTSVHFRRYKAFRDYSLSLHRFNVLVGPNNCGKSTILGAFRLLSEALRKARSRNPTIVPAPHGQARGYSVEMQNVPIATENVFFDYDDSQPATVNFRISNGNELLLFFPKRGVCYLICETTKTPVTSTASFKSQYNISIGLVPILGPVEHDEPLYQKEAARSALLTHHAARNFRNIWHHYPENFDEFRALVSATWPGMDIQKPEIDATHSTPFLRMFCPEERIPREMFWAGFGFQVWCQMLTYIIQGADSSVLIIDEPDIYLHSDLQRQLLGILKTVGPDVLIATHSTELISEADPDDLLVINKAQRSAKRIKDPAQLQGIFQVLGSNLNPVLTQLAKTKRALFVEGKDFQIISRFARKLGKNEVANRSAFAVVPVEGFNPTKVRDFTQGIQTTLGTNVVTGVIFDRDYRSLDECQAESIALKKHCRMVHIHQRKELENFLLVIDPIKRAIERRIAERNKRTGEQVVFGTDVEQLLLSVTNPLRHKIESRYLARRRSFEKSKMPGLDEATIDEQLMSEFDAAWSEPQTRVLVVPGKEVLTELNKLLQDQYKITVSTSFIIECFGTDEIPREMADLIQELERFCGEPTA